MYELVNMLEDMVLSYFDSEDPSKLSQQCQDTLDGIQEKLNVMMLATPDQVAFSFFPNVYLSDEGESYIDKQDIMATQLPSWDEVKKKKFFKINGKGDLIRSLAEIDKKAATQIFFAIGYVKKKIREEELV